MSDIKLGSLIYSPDASRDAIHVAIAPVSSKERLRPGTHVGLVTGSSTEVTAESETPIGIVDPFLVGFVKSGQLFWLCLYQQTVTGMTHVWRHPSFPEGKPAEPVTEKSASEKWMRNWAVNHMGHDYYGDGGTRSEQVSFEAAIKAGREMSVGPYQSAADHIDSDWWTHWENITGMTRPQDQSYFSCSC